MLYLVSRVPHCYVSLKAVSVSIPEFHWPFKRSPSPLHLEFNQSPSNCSPEARAPPLCLGSTAFHVASAEEQGFRLQSSTEGSHVCIAPHRETSSKAIQTLCAFSGQPSCFTGFLQAQITEPQHRDPPKSRGVAPGQNRTLALSLAQVFSPVLSKKVFPTPSFSKEMALRVSPTSSLSLQRKATLHPPCSGPCSSLPPPPLLRALRLPPFTLLALGPAALETHNFTTEEASSVLDTPPPSEPGHVCSHPCW